jgi:hypothetical protein
MNWGRRRYKTRKNKRKIKDGWFKNDTEIRDAC